MTILDASQQDAGRQASRHDADNHGAGQHGADAETAFDSLLDHVRAEFDTTFTWDYERSRDGLNRLYEKAKRSQWNVSDDLDWSIDVDPERSIRLQVEATGVPAGMPARSLLDVKGSPVASWDDDKWVEFAVQAQSASLSQFLHGEQGALLCTARLVEAVPWIDAKYYAATQVVDEARHVEAFARYLDEKMPATYPINENLKSLIDQVLRDERWDLVYLGMQVVIEGLALAAFGLMLGTTQEPLLKAMLRYVMADEARHVAFGILSLQELYEDMDSRVARQTTRLAQKTGALRILYDIAASINHADDLDALLLRYMRVMKEMVNGRSATMRLTSSNGTMRLLGCITADGELMREHEMLPVQLCRCGRTL
jgi:hypothetical protein